MELMEQGGGQLMELLRGVATQEEGNALCHRVLQTALKMLSADRASLYLVTRSGGQKYLVPRLFDVTATSKLEEALNAYNSESSLARRLAIGEGIIGAAGRGRTPLYCNNTSNDSQFQPRVDVCTGYHTRSILAAPVLNFHDKVIGVASVLNKSPYGQEHQGFTEQDGKMLQQLTAFCTVAIATLDPQGMDPVEMSRHDVIRRLAETILEESSNLGTLVPAVMQQATTLIKCERCLVFIANEPESANPKRVDGNVAGAVKRDPHSASFREMYDYKPTACNPKVVKYKTFSSEFSDVAFRVLATGSWFNMEDWGRTAGQSTDTGVEAATRGLLAAPVMDPGHRALAALLLTNRHDGRPFSPPDIRLTALLCNFLGLGLHSALSAKEAGGDLPRQRVALAALGQHIQGAESEALQLMEAPRLCGHDAGLYSPSFQLHALSDMDTLRATLAIFVEGGFVRYFELPREVLSRWLCCVYKNYGEGGYHCWRHAFSTTQAMYALLNAASMADLFGPVEMLALLAACLCHDLDHQESSSFHRPLSASALASLYSSNFHEHYHFTSSVLILERPGHNIFSTLSTADYRRALACMGLAVQATDLSTHFYQRDSFRELLRRGDCNFSSRSERLLLMSMLVTAADLGAFTRPFAAHLVEVQPLLQRLEEKEKRDCEISSMHADVQVMFIDWICLPVYEMLSEKWPNIAPWMDNVIRNRDNWKTKSSGYEGDLGEEVQGQRGHQERRRRPGSRQRRVEDKSPLRCEDPDPGHEAEELPAVRGERVEAMQARLHAEYLEIVRRLKEAIEQQKAGQEGGKDAGGSGQNAGERQKRACSPKHLGIPSHLEETTAEPDLMEVLHRDKERRAQKRERGRSPQETTPSKETKEQGCQQEVNIDVYPSPQLRNRERSRQKEEEKKKEKECVPPESPNQENKKTAANTHAESPGSGKRGSKGPKKELVAKPGRNNDGKMRPQSKSRQGSRSRSPEKRKAAAQEKPASPHGRRDVGSDPMASVPGTSACHWSEEAVRSLCYSGVSSGAPCPLPLKGVAMAVGEGASTSADVTLGSSTHDLYYTGTLDRWEEAKSPHKAIARCLLSPARGDEDNNAIEGELKTRLKSLCGNRRYADTQNKASNHPMSGSSSEETFVESRSFISVVIQLQGFPMESSAGASTVCRGCQTEESALLESLLRAASCWQGECGPCSHCGNDHCREVRLEWMAPEGSPFFTNLNVDLSQLQNSKDGQSYILVKNGKRQEGSGTEPTLCPEELSSGKLAEMESKMLGFGRCLEGCQAPCCGSDPDLHCHETLVTWEAPAGSSFFTNCPIDLDSMAPQSKGPPCHKALEAAGLKKSYADAACSCGGPATLDAGTGMVGAFPGQPFETARLCTCDPDTYDVAVQAVFRFPRAMSGTRNGPAQQCTCELPRLRVQEYGAGLCTCESDEEDVESEEPFLQAHGRGTQASVCPAPHVYTQTSSVTVMFSDRSSQD